MNTVPRSARTRADAVVAAAGALAPVVTCGGSDDSAPGGGKTGRREDGLDCKASGTSP
ncbi:hypothetical protein ACFYO5_09605 [Streptomyces sp. NPDC006259]|uniref:hypothetical protein n=1 Tax=Streptomyces sp. NPDC006259 TaxID=3364740 RepID=UPI0036CC4262